MYWKKEWTVPSITGVISFGVGVAVGYAATTYYRYRKLEEIITEIEGNTSELENDIFQLSQKLEDRSQNLHEALQYAWNIVGSVAQDDEDGDEEQEIEDSVAKHPTNSGLPMMPHSIFSGPSTENNEPDWNYQEETASRTPDAPFVIHRDEFEDGEDGYSHSNLTYYQGDDILADEQDGPVYNPERIVGELKFGHGSGDPNVVYIRNDRLMADYEVILDHGYYQVEVLGEEIEQVLSRDKSEPIRFRSQD